MSAPSEKKSKEIKIETKHVVKPEDIVKNERIMKLLLIMDIYGDISEKGLINLVYELKEQGYDLGYSFFKIGDTITSKQLREDMLSLLYVDFVETIGRAKKLRVTGFGREALTKASLSEEERSKIKSLIDKIRPKIASIDAEVELFHTARRR